jgi:hypothetical protein
MGAQLTTAATHLLAPARADAPPGGLPAEQVREWLEHVLDDLRRVRARLEFLGTEQARLERQQHLLAELVAASTAV